MIWGQDGAAQRMSTKRAIDLDNMLYLSRLRQPTGVTRATSRKDIASLQRDKQLGVLIFVGSRTGPEQE